MAIAVLPRADAAVVINRAVARSSWVVAFAILVMGVPGLVDVLAQRGLAEQLTVPMLALVVMLVMLVVVALRPVPLLVLVYVLIAGVCIVVYQVALLRVDPSLAVEARYVLFRPASAIVLLGTLGSNTLTGVLWAALGFIVSLGSSFLAAGIAGVDLQPGTGPAVVFTVYAAVFLALALSQRGLRRLAPSFERTDARARYMEAEQRAAGQTLAAVNDTVLKDLAFILEAPDVIDDAARARLRDDLAIIANAEWLDDAGEQLDVSHADAFVRNLLAGVVSEMQWHGLTVHVSGNTSATLGSSTTAAAAAVDAARSCLENVLAHSGVYAAQLVLGQDDGESTIMVIDEGRGFDYRATPQDRLGLKVSVIQRVEAVGGYVRVWSTPGNGTSVFISVPAVSQERVETGSRSER